jgi:hypothetical protein
MKRFLTVLAVLFAALLVYASGDVRSVLGWLMTAYLVFRAAPLVWRDLVALRRLVSSPRRFLRTLRVRKGDSL